MGREAGLDEFVMYSVKTFFLKEHYIHMIVGLDKSKQSFKVIYCLFFAHLTIAMCI